MKTYTTTIEKPMLVIEYDQFADHPRKHHDTLGYFITKSTKYDSPDDNEQLEAIIEETSHHASDTNDHMDKIKEAITEEMEEQVLYITPVYTYKHGNIVYQRGTAKGFDYINNGFYIVTDKTLAQYHGGVTDGLDMEKDIGEELKRYTQWANGEVYTFQLFDEDGELVDGYGDIYDLEDCRPAGNEWKDEDLYQYLNY